MIKYIKNTLKSQNGLSLLSVIGTMAVLGAGTYAAISLTKMSQRGQETTSRKIQASSITSMVETKLRSAFLDIKGPDGKLTQGICSLVKVGSLDSQLSNVYLQLPNPKNDPLFPSSTWEKAFTGLKEEIGNTSCVPKSKYGKCFRLDSNSTSDLGISDLNLKKMEPIFEIDIKPILTNPASATTFEETIPDGKTQYDLKAMAFGYSIRTSYKSFDESASRKLGRTFIQGFIWAGDVGVCEVGSKKISLTANSFGDPNESTVFNLAGFSSDSISKITRPPLEVTLLNSQIRSGVRGGSLGSQFLTSRDSASAENPDSGPVFSSCNENVFRCPQLNASERRYQFMRHMVRARYQVPNLLTNTGNSVAIASRMRFKNLKGLQIDNGYTEVLNMAGQTYEKRKDGWFYADIDGTSVPLRIGEEDTLVSRLSDTSNVSESNSTCRRICVPQTNFNSNPNDHFTAIFDYRVNMSSVPSGASTSFEIPSGPVACTACYMKNCDQFGLGTFGAMHVQPTEPLDAGIPECARFENHASSFYESKNFDFGIANGSSCVAGKLNSGDNSGFSLSARDCSSDLPVMCFSFGKHMLARQTSQSGSSIIKSNFQDASNVCYGLGREDIKKEPLRALLFQQGNLGPVELEFLGVTNPNLEISLDQRLEIINFIQQASFLSVVGLNQEARLREFADREGEKSDLLNNDVWLGLKTDSAGYLYAPAPKIGSHALDSEVKWGMHYDGGGRLIVRKVPNDLNLNTSTLSQDDQKKDIGMKVALLFHSPRFKGIHLARSVKPFGQPPAKGNKSNDPTELRVLCRKSFYPYEIFVTSKRTDNFLDASDVCRSEKGLFLPPLTTTGWVTAFQEVHQNHQRHAFPAIWNASELDPVWVNLLENGAEESMYLGKDFLNGSPSRFINGKGQFVQEDFEGASKSSKQDKANHSKACFDKDKGEIEFRNNCGKNAQLLTKEDVTAAASPKNFYLRFMLKVALMEAKDNELIKLYE